ncbi:hypothetical protein [Sandaracinus amylolyticus]|uniref:hypothetical protein n=1 Tax=Sandaracinus amylolyticus TaxID=927083 RepID=UPI001F3B2A8E|nr:hypothetical protein [Sandaracinus amylolyticus]UJR81466.1 Hypothetical protein I5071_35250 [Sandaracinus amylolyticus]
MTETGARARGRRPTDGPDLPAVPYSELGERMVALSYELQARARRLDTLTRGLNPSAYRPGHVMELAEVRERLLAREVHPRRRRARTTPRGPLLMLRWGDRELSYPQWSREPDVALTAQAIYERVKRGWTPAEALTTAKGASRPRSEAA